jgi:hypothetical protein
MSLCTPVYTKGDYDHSVEREVFVRKTVSVFVKGGVEYGKEKRSGRKKCLPLIKGCIRHGPGREVILEMTIRDVHERLTENGNLRVSVHENCLYR